MVWFLIALAILLAGGLLSLAVGRSPKGACLIGAASTLLGGGAVLLPVARRARFRPVAIPAAGVAVAAVWFGQHGNRPAFGGLRGGDCSGDDVGGRLWERVSPDASPAAKNLGVSWFFFNLLAASMLLVVVARNGVLFLMSWELMSLASFFLVTLEDEKESVRRAGWIYLVAMHLGTAFLLALFLLLGKNAGSLDFERLSAAAAPAQRGPLPAWP